MATKRKSNSKPVPKVDQRDATVQVNEHVARSDDDALLGHFVEVTGGKHSGRYGVLESAINPGSDGFPTDASVRTRDASVELLNVKYSDLKRAEAGRR